MNRQHLQFSLRSLFLATTVVAALVFAFARYPHVAVGCLSVSFPFLFPAVVAYLRNHATLSARFVLATVGILFLIFGAYCWIEMKDTGDHSDWIALALVTGLGFFFVWLTWSMAPTKADDRHQSDDASRDECL